MPISIPRLILAVVCLPVFIGALDLTIVSAVLPEVIRSMTIEIQKLDVAGWVVTGYFVSYAISMTFMGRVSDISGRRVVFLGCLVIFLSGRGWSRPRQAGPRGMASTVIASLRGRGSGARVCAVVCVDFRPRRSGVRGRRDGAREHGPGRRSLSSRETCAAAGNRGRGRYGQAGCLGHLYGGIMVQFMTWPYLFWINLPIIAVMFARDLVGTGRLAAVGREGRHRLDWSHAPRHRSGSAQPRPGLTGNRLGRLDEPRRSIRSIGWPARWSSS